MTLNQFAHIVTDLPTLQNHQWARVAAARALVTGKISRASPVAKQIIHDAEDALPDARDFDDLVSAILSDACV